MINTNDSTGNDGCSDRDYELCSHRKRLLKANYQLKLTAWFYIEENKKYRKYVDKLEKENEAYFQRYIKEVENF